MDNLDEAPGGAMLIELAKKSPKIPYDEDLKDYVKQLKEFFGDESICKLRD